MYEFIMIYVRLKYPYRVGMFWKYELEMLLLFEDLIWPTYCYPLSVKVRQLYILILLSFSPKTVVIEGKRA